MGLRLRRTVVLVGMMGAGKTAVGTALAKRLSVPFMDSDTAIEQAASRSIAEIFARDGEAFFRRRESQVIGRLLEGTPGILSTGGGAWLSADTRATIKARGVPVWLRADLDLLWTRVRQKEGRPLLSTPDPRATLTALYEARAPLYAKADLTVDSLPQYTVADMVEQVVRALLTRPDVLDKI